MGRAYSGDLRERVYGEIADGGTRRGAARRFGVSASTGGARTLDALWRAVGNICNLYSPEECWNYLKAAGCAPD